MVFAESTEEVADIVRVCAAHGVPAIPFGTGTSLEGHVNAPGGGISIDLMRMDRVVAVNTEDLDCIVQPGVTREALNQHLRATGLFFPIDPGANQASRHGRDACSGTNAVRYGTMRDNVIALTAVMADGSIVRTGKRARKSSAGYELTRLIVGSEGTLGIITELTLRLQGIPQAISGGVCPFPDVESACNAVIATIQSGIAVARDRTRQRALHAGDDRLFQAGLCREPVPFRRVPRIRQRRRRAGGAVRRHRRGIRWRSVPMDRRCGRPGEALEGTPRRLLGVHDASAGRTRALDRRLRAPISRLAECIAETEADIAAMA